ncbi:MAG: MBL fold metallo-hydrolase [Prolixibacteraceae bacterium]|nr:MBL fold metallo-hydrolase [Prolixibacteraceae bacterium]MBT6764135.1 MBL fold metallo-hydrolase [Prolixibacteraceae bacterium]MBT6999004.1 MBL fold metallo-hydrolase [Prolixibacteraceae bacterium]MBT7394497.1 MBL fold metallo-hydrolase [Prolixibacteraceae bacterium]
MKLGTWYFLLIFFVNSNSFAQTKVVLLGTGTPNPDPEHSGGSVAIVVGTTPYIVDFGPGLVRQAAKMSPRYGGEIEALSTKNLKTAFLTHLHSDHTVGFPDLLLTPWVMGRDEPLEVYGPEGTKNLTDNILNAYDADIKYRLYGLEPANNKGWRVNTHEFFEDGLIYEDSLVKVEAFKVIHGSWPNAYGFRFTTPDKTIVISGDTRPCANIQKYSEGADILIHEVYSYSGWNIKNEFWKKYHAANHTSTYELGELAAKTNPGKIVLYHLLFWGASQEDLLKEISEKYDGEVIVGRDLMVIE